jgi:predicted HD phosphohydrolase
MTGPLRTLDDVFALLGAGRRVFDGELVNVLAHSLQCAAILATREPDDVELQIAGLVHDIGTLLQPDHPATHAATGAAAVRPLLGDRCADLVAAHDQAKRYLVTVDPAYRRALSTRSIETLRAQGGLFDPQERAAFASLDCFRSALALRRADDAAKVPGRSVPGLDAWREALSARSRRR